MKLPEDLLAKITVVALLSILPVLVIIGIATTDFRHQNSLDGLYKYTTFNEFEFEDVSIMEITHRETEKKYIVFKYGTDIEVLEIK